MLDLANNLTMPIKETVTKISKSEDCGVQKPTAKRSPVDMKDALLKGGATGSGDGEELMLEVTCGQNQAALYMSRLQLGSKGTCVLFENAWLTPNEFQYISGRETAKDWKRSIKHHGKSLKVLISKGILTTSPLRCNCGQCAQVKDKDVTKYNLNDAAKVTSGALRESFVTDSAKINISEAAKDLPDRRFFRVPGDSNEKLRDGLLETPTKQPRPLAEQSLTAHSQEGARYLPSCDKRLYGPSHDAEFRYDRQEPLGGGGGCSNQGGHPTNHEQRKMTDAVETKLKGKSKLDGNENEEFTKEGSRGLPNADQRKAGSDGNKNDVTESSGATNALGHKACASSGARSTSGGHGSWNHSGAANPLTEQPFHSELNSCKLSPHEKTKKTGSFQSMSSSLTDRPSCSQLNIPPSGKNSIPNGSSSGVDPTRVPSSESSFMYPSFGSPYYPMIPTPQLPGYYSNPYIWPMPFPTNPSTCSYGWTAPSDMVNPSCLRSPVKDAFDCNPSGGDQAFNFPWMKRTNYTTVDNQPGREVTNESISSGKRKLDADPSEYFPPSKHPFYLSDNLRPSLGDTITWPSYNAAAAAAAAAAATPLDFRFLSYSLPSYIPDGRSTHGLFANNFLKGSENPMAGGLGLYSGLFPSPCLGVNSR